MSYVEDKLHYEDWNVVGEFTPYEVKGDWFITHPTITEEYTISIVNDFYEIPMCTHEVEYEPLHYWVVDDSGTISDFDAGTYEDCVNWIKDNYLKSYMLEKS